MNESQERVVLNAEETQGLKYSVRPADENQFSSFKMGAIKHNFQHHPLMQMDKLQSLAEYLMPLEQCRFVAPDLQQDSVFFHYGKATDGRDLDEFFRRIEEPESWLALYNVEAHPDYQAFVEEVIDTVRPQVEREQGNIFIVNGFIFISAPPSVTPFHIDRENNFFLQVQGQKRITVFDNLDREVVSAQAVEEFIVNRNLDNVRLKKQYVDRGCEFNVGPGDGVYFPSTSPHMTRTTEEWVSPGAGVSVSIGVVFYTEHTRALAQVHQCNAVLRRLGLSPRPPGTNTMLEGIKRPIGKALAEIKARYRGYNPPPGAY